MLAFFVSQSDWRWVSERSAASPIPWTERPGGATFGSFALRAAALRDAAAACGPLLAALLLVACRLPAARCRCGYGLPLAACLFCFFVAFCRTFVSTCRSQALPFRGGGGVQLRRWASLLSSRGRGPSAAIRFPSPASCRRRLGPASLGGFEQPPPPLFAGLAGRRLLGRSQQVAVWGRGRSRAFFLLFRSVAACGRLEWGCARMAKVLSPPHDRCVHHHLLRLC